LLAGAMKVLKEAGAVIERITVPGSLEIPAGIVIALDAAEEKGRPYDGVVALGCVIRGDTIHFEIVSQLSAQGLLDLSVARALPLGNGIVTVNTLTQALARARLEDQDKGGDAARAALALIGLKKRLGAR
jgi:6,7-dimethyl-8-ribityllumazine synthase